ncbi:MAG TPA: hemolysin family protein [Gemmatimonadales bacterium]|nr:hemolysin family protein [Gemmatimonadales bacterium]
MIRAILAALQLWVAPILATVFTLASALVALAEHDDSGVPRLLVPAPAGPPSRAGPMAPARSLHVVHLALLAMAAALAGTAVSWWAWAPAGAVARFLTAVLLVWILGELAPRLWAANEPGLVRFEGRFVQSLLALFRPLLAAVAWVDRGFRRRRAPIRPVPPALAPGEPDMLTGLLGLNDMTVADVMTPRLDIITADFSTTREQVVEAFRRAEHSRLLVVDGDPDSVTGVLYAKDLLPGLGVEAEPADWHYLIRPVGFVPEAKTLDRQLRDFQLSASHLVVVVDEFGGTSGIVTLEDVLEQIVGEIRDEYDTEEVAPLQRVEGGWLVDGGAPLAELEAELDHTFEREDVSTVGGMVLALFGRVPRPGESIGADGFSFTVDQVVRRRIRRVTVGHAAAEPARLAASEKPPVPPPQGLP